MKRATDEIQRIEMMDAVERGREETRERRDLVFRVRLNSTFYLFQIYFSLAGSHFLGESRVYFSFEMTVIFIRISYLCCLLLLNVEREARARCYSAQSTIDHGGTTRSTRPRSAF
jgi:hypothetical protein